MRRMTEGLWKIAAEVNVNGRIPMKLYQSKRSALRIAVADVPGPMVKGMISFATETDCDDGLPHTLEHLVFMGSKRYPFKGVLDVIANRCLASGTNACTDQDNTSYTLTTVGSRGFLKVLPVYLDHLLSPTLTDSQYATEVHHINGEGEDAGVVYSEMQDHESDMESMVDRMKKELIYPPNFCYRVFTGGRLANLRTTCSNERVRAYHNRYYHLKNMMITVCGLIDHAALLAIVEPVEERELTKAPVHFERPFRSVVPPINGGRVARVVCPSDDETNGVVEMAWLGPAPSELYKQSALLVLFDYLTDTAVAPLQKDFVQLADPLCSSISAYMSEQTKCEIALNFSGVPTDKLDDICHQFFDKTVLDHAKSSAFDMERIGFIIDQLIKRYLTKMENNASSMIFNGLVGHQLYGTDGDGAADELKIRLNEVDTLRRLKRETADFWRDLFQQTFTQNYGCVVGEPSITAVDEHAKAENERLEKQRKALGEDGLKKCEQSLKDAIHANTAKKPTADVLADLIVSDLEKFNTFNIRPATNAGGDDALATANGLLGSLPFTVVQHSVPSDFVDMVLLIDTKDVPLELRHYLMLWFELIFQSPAIVDGQTLSFEEVSKLSTRDLVSHSISVGINGVYDRLVTLRLRVDADNYANLAKWTEIYLRNIVFDAKRIAVCAKKLASAAAETKRDGSNVSAFLSTTFAYDSDANTNFYNYISLERFHKSIAARADANASAIIDRLERLRAAVLDGPVNVHFACDPSKIHVNAQRHTDLWNFMPERRDALFSCPPDYGADWSRAGVSNALAVGGTESSFLLQKALFPEDWSGESVMETLLLAQYLTQCEGPLWNGVRGEGLAYDASIYVLPDRKSLTLSLYRCSQLAHAYEQTKRVVLDNINAGKLEESQFEAAKRSLVCDLIGAQGTIKSAAVHSMLSTIRKTDPNFVTNLCARVWHADMDSVLRVGAPHIVRLFDDRSYIRSLATNPSKLAEVRKAFPKVNILKLEKLQICESKF